MQGSGSKRWRRRAGLMGSLIVLGAAVWAGSGWAAEGDLELVSVEPEYRLPKPVAMASSPDGSNVYVVGEHSFGDGEIHVLDRDAGTGELALVEIEREGVDDPGDAGGPAAGIGSPSDVAVSPDGEFVYVADQGGDTLGVFDRDTSDGELSFVSESADLGTSLRSVAITPDGDHVLVTDASTDSVTLVARNESTGALGSILDVETDGINDGSDAGGSVNGLDTADGVAVSANGASVYTAGEGDDSVAVFSRDAGTGELSFLEFEDDGVDDATDAGGTVDGLNGAIDLLVAGAGDRVYVAGSNDNSVAVFDRSAVDGKLSFLEFEDDGVDDLGDAGGTVEGLLGANALATDGDDDHIYALGEFDAAIAVFRANAAGLRFREAEFDGADDAGDAGGTADALQGPMDVMVSPDGADVYVASEDEDGIAGFARDDTPTEGNLSFERRFPAYAASDAAATVASPDGDHVLVSVPSTDTVLVYERNGATGELELVDSETGGTNDPSDAGGAAQGIGGTEDLAVAPDGADVYVAGFVEDGIGVFSRNGSTGELSFVESELDGVLDPDSGLVVDGLTEASGVAVSPDGDHVYAVSNGDYALVAFERDSVTGRLTFVEAEFDGQGDVPVDALYGPQDVVISPDGRFLYVPNLDGDTVSVFERNASTGAVDFVEVETDEVDDPGDAGGAVADMTEPSSVAIPAGGDSVYVGTLQDGSLAVFGRNAANGELSYETSLVNGEAGVTGLAGVSSVAVTADGKQVIAAARDSDGLVSFDRDLDGGALSFASEFEPSAEELDGVTDLSIVDDEWVYASAGDADLVAVVSREPDTTGPRTKLDDKPKKKRTQSKRKKTEKFKFSSPSDDAVEFECRKDKGKDWKSCSSPYKKKYKAGKNGFEKYTFSVRAIDTSGNKDPSPADFTFKRKLK